MCVHSYPWYRRRGLTGHRMLDPRESTLTIMLNEFSSHLTEGPRNTEDMYRAMHPDGDQLRSIHELIDLTGSFTPSDRYAVRIYQ
jgi:hypothetical protein